MLRHDRHLIGYAAGNFGKAVFIGSIDVTLLFLLTDILGIPPRQVGLLMLIAFVGNLAFDLGAGIVAERLERRGIGYPLQIAWAVAPCACAFVMLYALPLAQVRGLVPVALLLLALRGAFALIDVPHNSLMARVTTDSHARGRVSGYRTLFSSAASIAVATVIAPAMDAAGAHAAPARMAWPRSTQQPIRLSMVPMTFRMS